MCPQRNICGYTLCFFYFLADGIFPKKPFFSEVFPPPVGVNQKLFARHQEGAREAVDHVLGVLCKKYRIIYMPSRFWHLRDTEACLLACVFIYNMTGGPRTRLPKFRESDFEGLTFLSREEENAAMPSGFYDIVGSEEVDELKKVLVEYIVSTCFENVGFLAESDDEQCLATLDRGIVTLSEYDWAPFLCTCLGRLPGAVSIICKHCSDTQISLSSTSYGFTL